MSVFRDIDGSKKLFPTKIHSLEYFSTYSFLTSNNFGYMHSVQIFSGICTFHVFIFRNFMTALPKINFQKYTELGGVYNVTSRRV